MTPDQPAKGHRELVPASDTNLLTFLRSNGLRFLGRPFEGDEFVPVERALTSRNPGLSSLAVPSLAHDILHISAFILAHERLMRIAPRDISQTLVPDVIHAVWNNQGTLSKELLVKLVAFADVFERRKEEVRSAQITFTVDEKTRFARRAVDIARIAKEQIDPPPTAPVNTADAIQAAFRGIDQGFNDYGDTHGAISTPPFPQDSGSSSGKTADMPPSDGSGSTGAEVDEEDLVGAGPGRRRNR